MLIGIPVSRNFSNPDVFVLQLETSALVTHSTLNGELGGARHGMQAMRNRNAQNTAFAATTPARNIKLPPTLAVRAGPLNISNSHSLR